jgi:hypothetical protein
MRYLELGGAAIVGLAILSLLMDLLNDFICRSIGGKVGR